MTYRYKILSNYKVAIDYLNNNATAADKAEGDKLFKEDTYVREYLIDIKNMMLENVSINDFTFSRRRKPKKWLELQKHFEKNKFI